MRVRALALDYDGTIASAGALDPDARMAIEEVRSQGIIVIIVTGRMLDDLRTVAGDLRLVDAVVAENGAVVAFPAWDSRSLRLAPPPSSELVQDLRARGFHIDAGESVIAAQGSIAYDVLQSIRTRELPLVLVFNGESLMVLPQSVSKGTGLREALRLLGESPHNAVGIGDRENDHALLHSCGTGVAVGCGSETLKATAQIVLEGSGPPAVAEFLRSIARNAWIQPGQMRTELVPLGYAAARPVSLPLRGRNVLVVGDRHSETSWITGLICEHLILSGYSTSVIDIEGAQKALANLPGALIRRGRQPIRSTQVARTFTDPQHSMIVDASRFSNEHQSEYVRELVTTMATQRRQRGRPHWIVIDPIDPLLPTVVDAESGGYVLTCPNAGSVPAEIWPTIEACVATRITNPDDVAALADGLGASNHEEQWRTVLTKLPAGDAVILSHNDHPEDTLAVIRLADRLKCLHRRKTGANQCRTAN
jgi:hydroxymethylpyrimidine pyrophosphatase-like HAD family hydrolase